MHMEFYIDLYIVFTSIDYYFEYKKIIIYKIAMEACFSMEGISLKNPPF